MSGRRMRRPYREGEVTPGVGKSQHSATPRRSGYNSPSDCRLNLQAERLKYPTVLTIAVDRFTSSLFHHITIHSKSPGV